MKKILFLSLLLPTLLFSVDTEELSERLYQLLNRFRTEEGLDELLYSVELEKIASYHAENMADENFYSHTDLDGLSSQDRFELFYPEYFVGISENIVRTANLKPDTQEQSEILMQSWIDSPGHYANMVSDSPTHVGIASSSNQNYIFAVQNFGHFYAKILDAPATATSGEDLTLEFQIFDFDYKETYVIWIYFPDETARYSVPGVGYYTGVAKLQPEWIDFNTFSVTLDLNYGIGDYEIRLGVDGDIRGGEYFISVE